MVVSRARHDKKLEVAAVLAYSGLVRRTRWTTYGVKRTKWAKCDGVHVWKICSCLQWSGTLPNIYPISHRYWYLRCYVHSLRKFSDNNFVFSFLHFIFRTSQPNHQAIVVVIITGKLLQFLHSPLSVPFYEFFGVNEGNDSVVWAVIHGWQSHWARRVREMSLRQPEFRSFNCILMWLVALRAPCFYGQFHFKNLFSFHPSVKCQIALSTLLMHASFQFLTGIGLLLPTSITLDPITTDNCIITDVAAYHWIVHSSCVMNEIIESIFP